ncbi:hypothetical protein MASR2M78_24040 [Treponema sp.]
MNYSGPTKLAVLACPGGERFADEVIVHLKRLYRRRFDHKSAVLAKRYGLEKDEVIRKINFANDIAATANFIPGDVMKFRSPAFKIPARFTYFPNGEIKTEILESIRGKDVYIFQDVENHRPIAFNEGKNIKTLTVNDHLMNLFVAVDAAKQAGAEQVTLVIPVYPYSRQHKKKSREGLTASRIGKMLEAMGWTASSPWTFIPGKLKMPSTSCAWKTSMPAIR